MKTIEKINQWVYNNPFKYHVYTKLPLVVLVIFYVIFFMEWMMSREEFFEWLSTCPSEKMFFINDDCGNTTIRFEYEEVNDD